MGRSLPTSWLIAFRSLRRNKLQTMLTMLGMTIGVATVLTMISLGSGAQKAIQDQVKAAGMNMIVVTAGNYQARREQPPDDAIEMGALNAPAAEGRPHLQLAAFHPEDDPSQFMITPPPGSVLEMSRPAWVQPQR
jgi:putative ABC transport system permease protein